MVVGAEGDGLDSIDAAEETKDLRGPILSLVKKLVFPRVGCLENSIRE